MSYLEKNPLKFRFSKNFTLDLSRENNQEISLNSCDYYFFYILKDKENYFI